MRLKCHYCGEAVSGEVPEETVVRAISICPACIEDGGDVIAQASIIRKTIHDNTWIVVPTKIGEGHCGYSIIDRLQREHGSKMHSRATARRVCDAHNASLNEFKKRAE
jgi:thiamine monophosphate kinase